jgi:pimeloyl-ACP methyl ester carboxylesterase
MKKILYIILSKGLGLYINILSFVYPKKSLELAYQYFTNPTDGRLNAENLPEILLEANREVITIDDHYFQSYIWPGNENKILLIHGWESNASRWENFLPYLKKSGSTIIAIDAPAHGLSSGREFNVPTYAKYINAISEIHKPKYIVGHSLGGAACAFYQRHYQNHQIQKMVLLGTPSDAKIIFKNYINMLGLNLRVYEYLRNYSKKRFDNLDIEKYSIAKTLQNTTISGIIAHDILDDVVSFEESKKIAQTWKTAQVIKTNGLGHSMHDDKLYKTIYTFLFEA